jgi:hypothetical protein
MKFPDTRNVGARFLPLAIAGMLGACCAAAAGEEAAAPLREPWLP